MKPTLASIGLALMATLFLYSGHAWAGGGRYRADRYENHFRHDRFDHRRHDDRWYGRHDGWRYGRWDHRDRFRIGRDPHANRYYTVPRYGFRYGGPFERGFHRDFRPYHRYGYKGGQYGHHGFYRPPPRLHFSFGINSGR